MIKKVVGSVFLILLVGIAIYQVMNHQGATTGADEGKKAIDFKLTNLQGEEVSLSDYKGKKVFLNFWATWCPPCRAEMPEMEKIHKEYEDVEILAVNMDSDKDIQGFMDQMNLTFPVLLDKKMLTRTTKLSPSQLLFS